MYFDLIPSYKIDKNDFENKELLISKIKEINDICLAETYKGNKVSYYYENAINGDVFSYNREIGFYAASSIKILPALILFEKADKNEVNLNEKILVNLEDLKQGSGSIKEIKENKEFSIIELIKLSLVESDNTAYLKLVDFLGKDSIKEYGLSIGATHTMESRPNDNFGIVNCNDMILYWKKIIEFINNSDLGPLFKSFLSNPNTKLIDFESINNQSFLRKYGAFDIAYHEAGYIEGTSPYYLIILTQLNKFEYKNKFVNDIAKRILEIHNIARVIPREKQEENKSIKLN